MAGIKKLFIPLWLFLLHQLGTYSFGMDKRIWEFKALQSFGGIFCGVLPAQFHSRASSIRACLTLLTMMAKLPWTTITVGFEPLSDFLAFFGVLTASALTFLVKLQSNASLCSGLPRQSLDHTSPTQHPTCWHRAGTCKAVECDCRQLLSKASTFPQPLRSRFPSIWVELSILFIQELLW